MRLKKLTAGTTAAVYFLVNAVFLHAGETNFWRERRASRPAPVLEARLPAAPDRVLQSLPSVGQSLLSPEAARGLPRGFLLTHQTLLDALARAPGTLRRISLPPGGAPARVVVHIQDVHMNAEAQRNIRDTVQTLIDARAAGLVALEGAFGPVDLTSFRTFPDRAAVADIAGLLLDKNKISGPVHAALTSAADIPPFVGVDDRAHYGANVEAYRSASLLVPARRESLAAERAELDRRKAAVFNPDLLAFDERVSAFHDGAVPFGDYVGTVAAREASGQAALFLKALRMEKSLDFPRVEAERARLIEALVPRLSKARTEALVRSSAAYRAGRLRYADFYRELEGLCQSGGVPLSGFPALDAYVRYVLMADGIDAGRLMTEAAALEKASYGRLARTAEEKSLVAAAVRLRLAGKLVDFSLTPEEWAEHEALIPAAEAGENSSFEDFYREAHARDGAMAENLLKAWPADRGAAVLVTGGFHAGGLTERLTQAGCAVISFVPRLEKADLDRGTAYLSVFTQEKTPLENLFRGGKLFLAPVQMPESPSLTALAGALVAARAKASAGARAVEEAFGSLVQNVAARVRATAGGVIVRLSRDKESVDVSVLISDEKVVDWTEQTVRLGWTMGATGILGTWLMTWVKSAPVQQAAFISLTMALLAAAAPFVALMMAAQRTLSPAQVMAGHAFRWNGLARMSGREAAVPEARGALTSGVMPRGERQAEESPTAALEKELIDAAADVPAHLEDAAWRAKTLTALEKLEDEGWLSPRMRVWIKGLEHPRAALYIRAGLDSLATWENAQPTDMALFANPKVNGTTPWYPKVSNEWEGGGDERVIAGRYVFTPKRDKLGAGSWSNVYKAFDKRTNQYVALKVSLPEENDKARQALSKGLFKKEYINHRKLDGMAGVPRALDAGWFPDGANEGSFIAMEFIPGAVSLEAHRARIGRAFRWDEILEIGAAVAGLLADVHRRGFVIADLKESNILVVRGRDGRIERVMLVDFASLVTAPNEYESLANVVISAEYASPQAMGNAHSAAGDRYAFGSMLYRMWDGRFPFETHLHEAPGKKDYSEREKQERLQDLRRIKDAGDLPPFFRGGAPAGLWELVRALLDPDPARRPKDLAARLLAIRDAVPPEVRDRAALTGDLERAARLDNREPEDAAWQGTMIKRLLPFKKAGVASTRMRIWLEGLQKPNPDIQKIRLQLQQASQWETMAVEHLGSVSLPLGETPWFQEVGYSKEDDGRRSVGRYLISNKTSDELGSGFTSKVYRAFDTVAKKNVVIKLQEVDLRKHGLKNMSSLFKLEFLRQDRLEDAPTTPEAYEAGYYETEDGRTISFIAMEDFPGAKTLMQELDEAHGAQRPMPWEDIRRVGEMLLAAATDLKRRGFLMVDLKEENVLVIRGADGKVSGIKLLDYGSALYAPDDKTVTSSTAITPEPSAPESFPGKNEHNLSTQQYAVAAMLYHMVADKRPFDSKFDRDKQYEEFFADLFDQKTRPEGPPPFTRQDVPAALWPLIRAMLQADPAARPKDALTDFRALPGENVPGKGHTVPIPPHAPAGASVPRGLHAVLVSLAVFAVSFLNACFPAPGYLASDIPAAALEPSAATVLAQNQRFAGEVAKAPDADRQDLAQASLRGVYRAGRDVTDTNLASMAGYLGQVRRDFSERVIAGPGVSVVNIVNTDWRGVVPRLESFQTATGADVKSFIGGAGMERALSSIRGGRGPLLVNLIGHGRRASLELEGVGASASLPVLALSDAIRDRGAVALTTVINYSCQGADFNNTLLRNAGALGAAFSYAGYNETLMEGIRATELGLPTRRALGLFQEPHLRHPERPLLLGKYLIQASRSNELNDPVLVVSGSPNAWPFPGSAQDAAAPVVPYNPIQLKKGNKADYYQVLPPLPSDAVELSWGFRRLSLMPGSLGGLWKPGNAAWTFGFLAGEITVFGIGGSVAGAGWPGLAAVFMWAIPLYFLAHAAALGVRFLHPAPGMPRLSRADALWSLAAYAAVFGGYLLVVFMPSLVNLVIPVHAAYDFWSWQRLRPQEQEEEPLALTDQGVTVRVPEAVAAPRTRRMPVKTARMTPRDVERMTSLSQDESAFAAPAAPRRALESGVVIKPGLKNPMPNKGFYKRLSAALARALGPSGDGVDTRWWRRRMLKGINMIAGGGWSRPGPRGGKRIWNEGWASPRLLVWKDGLERGLPLADIRAGLAEVERGETTHINQLGENPFPKESTLWFPKATFTTHDREQGVFQVDGYRFSEKDSFGKGGFGRVFRAWDVETGREAALKIFHKGELPDSTARAMAAQEYLRQRRLEGAPGILQAYKAGWYEEYPNGPKLYFIVMAPLMGASSLHQEIDDAKQAGGLLSWDDILRIAVDVAETMEAAHREGILLCDLKDGNILVRRDNGDHIRKVAVVDLGSANYSADGRPVRTNEMATPESAAPETLVAGALQSAASDRYSLGVVLHQMATGEYPFTADVDPEASQQAHHRALVHAKLTKAPPPIDRDGMPEGFAELVRGLLNPDPDKRPDEVAFQLRAMRKAYQEMSAPALVLAAAPASLGGLWKPASRGWTYGFLAGEITFFGVGGQAAGLVWPALAPVLAWLIPLYFLAHVGFLVRLYHAPPPGAARLSAAGFLVSLSMHALIFGLYSLLPLSPGLSPFVVSLHVLYDLLVSADPVVFSREWLEEMREGLVSPAPAPAEGVFMMTGYRKKPGSQRAPKTPRMPREPAPRSAEEVFNAWIDKNMRPGARTLKDLEALAGAARAMFVNADQDAKEGDQYARQMPKDLVGHFITEEPAFERVAARFAAAWRAAGLSAVYGRPEAWFGLWAMPVVQDGDALMRSVRRVEKVGGPLGVLAATLQMLEHFDEIPLAAHDKTAVVTEGGVRTEVLIDAEILLEHYLPALLRHLFSPQAPPRSDEKMNERALTLWAVAASLREGMWHTRAAQGALNLPGRLAALLKSQDPARMEALLEEIRGMDWAAAGLRPPWGHWTVNKFEPIGVIERKRRSPTLAVLGGEISAIDAFTSRISARHAREEENRFVAGADLRDSYMDGLARVSALVQGLGVPGPSGLPVIDVRRSGAHGGRQGDVIDAALAAAKAALTARGRPDGEPYFPYLYGSDKERSVELPLSDDIVFSGPFVPERKDYNPPLPISSVPRPGGYQVDATHPAEGKCLFCRLVAEGSPEFFLGMRGATGLRYRLGVNLNEYGEGHLQVVSEDPEPNSYEDPRRVKDLLLFTEARGAAYETFANGVGGGSSQRHMHFHSLRQKTAVWRYVDAYPDVMALGSEKLVFGELSGYPARARLFRSRDVDAVAERLALEIRSMQAAGLAPQLMARVTDDGVFEAVLSPVRWGRKISAATILNGSEEQFMREREILLRHMAGEALSASELETLTDGLGTLEFPGGVVLFMIERPAEAADPAWRRRTAQRLAAYQQDVTDWAWRPPPVGRNRGREKVGAVMNAALGPRWTPPAPAPVGKDLWAHIIRRHKSVLRRYQGLLLQSVLYFDDYAPLLRQSLAEVGVPFDVTAPKDEDIPFLLEEISRMWDARRGKMPMGKTLGDRVITSHNDAALFVRRGLALADWGDPEAWAEAVFRLARHLSYDPISNHQAEEYPSGPGHPDVDVMKELLPLLLAAGARDQDLESIARALRPDIYDLSEKSLTTKTGDPKIVAERARAGAYEYRRQLREGMARLRGPARARALATLKRIRSMAGDQDWHRIGEGLAPWVDTGDKWDPAAPARQAERHRRLMEALDDDIAALSDDDPSLAAGPEGTPHRWVANKVVADLVREQYGSRLWGGTLQARREKLMALVMRQEIKTVPLSSSGRWQEVPVIPLKGLYMATGNLAFVGMGRAYGRPVIYVDAAWADEPRVIQHEVNEIRGLELLRTDLRFNDRDYVAYMKLLDRDVADGLLTREEADELLRVATLLRASPQSAVPPSEMFRAIIQRYYDVPLLLPQRPESIQWSDRRKLFLAKTTTRKLIKQLHDENPIDDLLAKAGPWLGTLWRPWLAGAFPGAPGLANDLARDMERMNPAYLRKLDRSWLEQYAREASQGLDTKKQAAAVRAAFLERVARHIWDGTSTIFHGQDPVESFIMKTLGEESLSRDLRAWFCDAFADWVMGGSRAYGALKDQEEVMAIFERLTGVPRRPGVPLPEDGGTIAAGRNGGVGQSDIFLAIVAGLSGGAAVGFPFLRAVGLPLAQGWMFIPIFAVLGAVVAFSYILPDAPGSSLTMEEGVERHARFVSERSARSGYSTVRDAARWKQALTSLLETDEKEMLPVHRNFLVWVTQNESRTREFMELYTEIFEEALAEVGGSWTDSATHEKVMLLARGRDGRKKGFVATAGPYLRAVELLFGRRAAAWYARHPYVWEPVAALGGAVVLSSVDAAGELCSGVLGGLAVSLFFVLPHFFMGDVLARQGRQVGWGKVAFLSLILAPLAAAAPGLSWPAFASVVGGAMALQAWVERWEEPLSGRIRAAAAAFLLAFAGRLPGAAATETQVTDVPALDLPAVPHLKLQVPPLRPDIGFETLPLPAWVSGGVRDSEMVLDRSWWGNFYRKLFLTTPPWREDLEAPDLFPEEGTAPESSRSPWPDFTIPLVGRVGVSVGVRFTGFSVKVGDLSGTPSPLTFDATYERGLKVLEAKYNSVRGTWLRRGLDPKQAWSAFLRADLMNLGLSKADFDAMNWDAFDVPDQKKIWVTIAFAPGEEDWKFQYSSTDKVLAGHEFKVSPRALGKAKEGEPESARSERERFVRNMTGVIQKVQAAAAQGRREGWRNRGARLAAGGVLLAWAALMAGCRGSWVLWPLALVPPAILWASAHRHGTEAQVAEHRRLNIAHWKALAAKRPPNAPWPAAAPLVPLTAGRFPSKYDPAFQLAAHRAIFNEWELLTQPQVDMLRAHLGATDGQTILRVGSEIQGELAAAIADWLASRADRDLAVLSVRWRGPKGVLVERVVADVAGNLRGRDLLAENLKAAFVVSASWNPWAEGEDRQIFFDEHTPGLGGERVIPGLMDDPDSVLWKRFPGWKVAYFPATRARVITPVSGDGPVTERVPSTPRDGVEPVTERKPGVLSEPPAGDGPATPKSPELPGLMTRRGFIASLAVGGASLLTAGASRAASRPEPRTRGPGARAWIALKSSPLLWKLGLLSLPGAGAWWGWRRWRARIARVQLEKDEAAALEKMMAGLGEEDLSRFLELWDEKGPVALKEFTPSPPPPAFDDVTPPSARIFLEQEAGTGLRRKERVTLVTVKEHGGDVAAPTLAPAPTPSAKGDEAPAPDTRRSWVDKGRVNAHWTSILAVLPAVLLWDRGGAALLPFMGLLLLVGAGAGLVWRMARLFAARPSLSRPDIAAAAAAAYASDDPAQTVKGLLSGRPLPLGMNDMTAVARDTVERAAGPSIHMEEALARAAADGAQRVVPFVDADASVGDWKGFRKALAGFAQEGRTFRVVTPDPRVAARLAGVPGGLVVLVAPELFVSLGNGLQRVNLSKLKDLGLFEGNYRLFRSSVVELGVDPDETDGALRAAAAQAWILTALLKALPPAAVDWDKLGRALAAVLAAA